MPKLIVFKTLFRPTQIYEEKEWHGISSHHFTQRTRGVDVFVSVALAVTETPSSSGMGRGTLWYHLGPT
jgi:hypothetical protein